MNGREKIEAAMSPRGGVETPVVVCYEGIFIRDHWPQLTACPWWYQFSPDPEHQLAWRGEVINAIGQDWFDLPYGHTHAQCRDEFVDVRGDAAWLVNRRTGKQTRLVQPEISGQQHYGEEFKAGYSSHPTMPDSREALEAAIPMPDPAVLDRRLHEGVFDLAAALLKGAGHDRYPLVHVISPLWRCFAGWQFEDVMMRCVTDPELVAYACGRFLDHSRQAVQMAAALGARGIWIEECMTDMINPDQFARLNVPIMAALVEAIRACGLHSIYYYCGNPEGKWDSILSCGADALALEESKKQFVIDVEAVARRVAGRCALLGNLDAVGVLEDGSDETVRREINRQVAVGRTNGGRFVMSTGSPVTPGTPARRVRWYCDTVHAIP